MSKPTASPAFSQADVRKYYDQNTRAFVQHGQGGELGAIHRAVWGPGVSDRNAAFRFVEDQIVDLVRSLATDSQPAHVVDLGCGVAASLCYLAGRLPIRGTGVTISPVQAEQGRARIAAAGLSGRVTCVEGDYCALPSDVAPADLAYAIESFVHGPSPEQFFREAARLVRPGGVLVICDDVRRATRDRDAERSVREFTQGWRVNALLEAEAINALASRAGFRHESTVDLSGYLELRRPRDRAIQLLAALARWVPLRSMRLGPLVGGSALQTCLARGWIAYDLAMFRRTIT